MSISASAVCQDWESLLSLLNFGSPEKRQAQPRSLYVSGGWFLVTTASKVTESSYASVPWQAAVMRDRIAFRFPLNPCEQINPGRNPNPNPQMPKASQRESHGGKIHETPKLRKIL